MSDNEASRSLAQMLRDYDALEASMDKAKEAIMLNEKYSRLNQGELSKLRDALSEHNGYYLSEGGLYCVRADGYVFKLQYEDLQEPKPKEEDGYDTPEDNMLQRITLDNYLEFGVFPVPLVFQSALNSKYYRIFPVGGLTGSWVSIGDYDSSQGYLEEMYEEIGVINGKLKDGRYKRVIDKEFTGRLEASITTVDYESPISARLFRDYVELFPTIIPLSLRPELSVAYSYNRSNCFSIGNYILLKEKQAIILDSMTKGAFYEDD